MPLSKNTRKALRQKIVDLQKEYESLNRFLDKLLPEYNKINQQYNSTLVRMDKINKKIDDISNDLKNNQEVDYGI